MSVRRESAMRVVVIGAGVAGAAAVHAAERSGASVTWVDGGVGATALTSGALDLEPWEELARAIAIAGTRALQEPKEIAIARPFADAIGLWALPGDHLPVVATTAGVVRPTRGVDRALLDLAAPTMAGRTVLVPRVDRAQWDADWLARAWAEGARDLGPALDAPCAFRAVDAPVLRFDEEARVVDGELARRHDDPARLAWLADRLAPAIAAVGKDRAAVLVGPWLGAEAERATELSVKLGVPVGEALSGTAGTAGLRFEAARARLAGPRGELVRATVVRVEEDGSALRVVFAGERGSVRAHVVVLATGGLIGGGVTFVPPTRGAGWDGAESAKPAFRVSVDAPDLVPDKLAGSMHGPALDETAWPRAGGSGALEAAGAALGAPSAGARIAIVGDARRRGARTMLEAIVSGLSVFAAAVASESVVEEIASVGA